MKLTTEPMKIRQWLAVGAMALAVFQLPVRTFAASSERAELAKMKANEALVADHLVKFDTLDFDVYSTQKWERLSESHADDILVHYPDGHTSKGLKAHIEELKPMFTFCPDTTIKLHPVKFGKGPWTSVVGVMTGSFTKPLNMGGGTIIQPTGKAFKLEMCTVGHWTNGKMDEEFLFWDNLSFMRQIGVIK